MIHRSIILLCLQIVAIAFFATTIHAQSKTETQSAADDLVLATVGDYSIRLSQVDRQVAKVVGNRKLTDQQRKEIRLESLTHLVNRELVSAYLVDRGFEVGKSQIKLEVDLLSAKLDQVGKTLAGHLKEMNQTQAGLEHEIAWRLRWGKYLEGRLDDSTLQNYFSTYRRRFDGTQMRTAQVLFRTLPSDESVQAALELANSVKEKVEQGELTWQDAVQQNSIAPSRENGGEIDWIQFKGPMPRDFSQAAFELEVGEMAKPFASQFGVHLIKCLEIKPGSSDLGDVKDEVYRVASKDLFGRIANSQQSEFIIRYSEGWSPASTESNEAN